MSYLHLLLNSSNHKLEVMKELSTENINKIIVDSKPTMCGSDPLPSTVVKHHLNILLQIITRLINWSLRTEQLPQSLEKVNHYSSPKSR